MAKQTLFGDVVPVGVGPALLSNATFRLHIAYGAEGVPFYLLGMNDDHIHKVTINGEALWLYVRTYPSAGGIYERELYVSKEKDRKGHDVLHLKEGPRFFEVTSDVTFVYMLGYFLRVKISELSKTSK